MVLEKAQWVVRRMMAALERAGVKKRTFLKNKIKKEFSIKEIFS